MLADIHAVPRGGAYFAHLMIPHITHMLDHDCKVRADPLTWTSFGDLDISAGALNSAASRELRYLDYPATFDASPTPSPFPAQADERSSASAQFTVSCLGIAGAPAPACKSSVPGPSDHEDLRPREFDSKWCYTQVKAAHDADGDREPDDEREQT